LVASNSFDDKILSVSVALPDPVAFAAVSVTGVVASTCGVPEIKPEASTDKPSGNGVAENDVGELDAVI
jgi:hypothetical protein